MLKNSTAFYTGLLLLLVLHVPEFLLGDNSFIQVYDNFDGEAVIYSVLKHSKHLLCLNLDHNLLVFNNDIKTSYLPSSFNFINIFYLLFSSIWAFKLNALLVRIIAFYGVFKLMIEYFKIDNTLLVIAVSLIFAFLPHYTIYGLSIAGQPILLLSYIKLSTQKNRFESFFWIILYAFYSYFFLVGPFIISIVLYFLFKTRFQKRDYVIGVCVLCLAYTLFNYPLLYEYFFGVESHRLEQIRHNSTLFSQETLISFSKLLMFGIPQFSGFFTLPILLIAILNSVKKKHIKEFYLIIFIHIVYLLFDVFPINTSFNPSRFIVFSSFLWVLVLINICKSQVKFNPITLGLIVFIQAIVVYINNPILLHNTLYLSKVNMTSVINQKVIKPTNKLIQRNIWPLSNFSRIGMFGADYQIRERLDEENKINYQSFLSQNAFEKIKRKINTDKFTISIGFHPSITSFNQLKTLDGYLSYYPLDYKTKFRRIIQGELDKNESLSKYFNEWGNRFYGFSSEVYSSCKFDCFKRQSKKHPISCLSFNANQFNEMGGEYIISAVEILDFNDSNFLFLDKVEDPASRYTFYLYQLAKNKF